MRADARGVEHWALEAEPLEGSADLNHAAVAGAVAARHRRLPGELRGRAQCGNSVQHRFRPAREYVEAGLDELGDEHRIDHDLSAWQKSGGPRVLGTAETKDEGRVAAELLGEIRQRRDPDPAADEERALDVEPVAVPQRPEDADLVAGPEATERLRSRPDRVDEESQLAGRREAERKRPRQQAPGSFEHEELPRHAGLEVAALEPQQRVRPDPLGAGDAMPAGRGQALHRSVPGARRPAPHARSRSRARRRPRPTV